MLFLDSMKCMEEQADTEHVALYRVAKMVYDFRGISEFNRYYRDLFCLTPQDSSSDWCYESKEPVIVSVPVYSQLTERCGHSCLWETLSITGCLMEQMNQICQPLIELQRLGVINHTLHAKRLGTRLRQNFVSELTQPMLPAYHSDISDICV